MKKIILGLGIAILLGVGAVGVKAYKVIQLNSWDFTAQISDNGTNVRVYEIDQEKATCYVSVTNASQNTKDTDISCIAK